MKKLLGIIILGLLFTLSCSESDNPVETSEGTGRITIYLTDSPAEFDSIIICISRVEIHKSGNDDTSGWTVINDSLRYFDLLVLTNGATEVLGDTTLTAGKYTQIRLIVGDGSYVVDGEDKHDLIIPSGTQTGIKLNHSFDIENDKVYELLLDFNAERSIIVTGNGTYKLKPVIRVIPVVISGNISGMVLPLDSNPVVWTTAGEDTITTYTNDEGYFKLMGLLEGLYDVNVTPTNTSYRDTTISDVQVLANQDTDLGTIELESN